jgi:hypothetical protein
LVNHYADPVDIALGVVVTGTVNYTVQHTFDDVNDSAVTPTWFDHPTLAGQTASKDGNYAFPPYFIRITVNSGTGTAKLYVTQAGH